MTVASDLSDVATYLQEMKAFCSTIDGNLLTWHGYCLDRKNNGNWNGPLDNLPGCNNTEILSFLTDYQAIKDAVPPMRTAVNNLATKCQTYTADSGWIAEMRGMDSDWSSIGKHITDAAAEVDDLQAYQSWTSIGSRGGAAGRYRTNADAQRGALSTVGGIVKTIDSGLNGAALAGETFFSRMRTEVHECRERMLAPPTGRTFLLPYELMYTTTTGILDDAKKAIDDNVRYLEYDFSKAFSKITQRIRGLPEEDQPRSTPGQRLGGPWPAISG